MALTVQPFDPLAVHELEVSKNECGFYLDLYYRFIKEVVKNPTEPYINIFKRVRYSDNRIKLNAVNETSCYNEYDYMIQYAEFFTISKYFSMLIDSDIKLLDPLVANDYFDDKYYLSDSNKFTKKELMKNLRNAFNHNAKNSFELFRLIKSRKDINLAIEIFLRFYKFHLKIGVKDLYDIFGEMLDARSIYDYTFKDKNGNTFVTLEDLEKGLDTGIDLELTCYYDFDGSLVRDDRVITEMKDNDEFKKTISLTKSQLDATKSIMKELYSKYGKMSLSALPFVLRDNIPFGMTKIFGYGFDLNHVIPDLYNPRSCYKNLVDTAYGLNFVNAPEEAETLYYSVINAESLIDRSFSLFASHVLDSILTEDTSTFKLDSVDVKKKHYRNGFVHGRWYNYLNELGKRQIAITDYEHGNKNIMDSSLENGDTQMTVDQEKLYKSLRRYITPTDYDLPLSFVKDNSGNGYHITFRVNGVNYYCNASLTKKSPVFLFVGDKKGKLFTPKPFGEEFKLFEKMINETNLDNLSPKMAAFIKKMPRIARKAYNSLMKNNTDREYLSTLSSEVNELLDICTEEKLGIKPDSGVIHFHY